MRRHFDDDAIETYMAVSSSGKDIAAGAQMMGLLAARRLIIVTGADAWKADDVSAVVRLPCRAIARHRAAAHRHQACW